MEVWQIVGVVMVLTYIAYWGGNLFFKARAARALMSDERPFTDDTGNYEKTLLVLGDSTGSGVGAAAPEESVAGRLATYIGATHVENYAESGAEVRDLPEQIAKAKLPRYDLILVHIGGNDILWFHNAKATAHRLKEVLGTLPDAGQVLLVTAGNVGGATLFPPTFRYLHMWTTLQFHKEFTKAASVVGATYVNLYEAPNVDPFMDEPERYLAEDGLHPSSEGYRLWFEKVKAALRAI
ncbi:MAG TPA: SGNH/GDSL hydrolase family protein [Candidatus Paceibacterota bacterium]|nr:SGNH/GDSL hydrolase family protein [Candidatus Paceibacterota bacterium]